MSSKRSTSKGTAESSPAEELDIDQLLTQHQEQLLALSERVLDGRTLIIASNRGPVTFRVTPDGDVEGQPGAGGVVTAMSAISNYANPIWVASAMTEGDRQRAQETEGQHIQWSTGDYRYRLHFVVVPRRTYEMYYGMIANPLLWFLQHYMWDAPRTPTITAEVWDAWHQGYEAANQAFAETIVEEIGWTQDPPLIMLHDYHLYLCPGYLRSKLADDAILHQFLHIPWPGPDYWAMLPEEMRCSIFSSLCDNDILGFHTRSYALNFLRTCETFLPGADVDYGEYRVTLKENKHTTWVRHYPISIDVADLRKLAESDEVAGYVDMLQAHTGEMTIVRTDRAEPSKNIVRGFKAFRILLERYPEYHGRIKFLAFLVPSRTEVEQYQRYLDEISGAAMWINAEYGTGDWEPVELFMGGNYPRAIAGMKLYDVLLVNPIIDGMNLVSKEGPMVNERDGVLVLSEGAGSHEQLGELLGDKLTPSPYDIVGTAQAMHLALQMKSQQRKELAKRLQRKIAEEDLTMWLTAQLEDIQKFAKTRG